VILAFLNHEAGFGTAAEMLPQAAVSAVNVAEVATKLSEKGGPDVGIRRNIARLRLEIIDVDADLAFRIGALGPLTRPFGLSLGDRACLATAQRLGVPAVTADRGWLRLDVGVEIQVIR